MSHSINIHFSDFFNIKPEILDEYGAFNVSLVNDLPLFIDPFLIFNSPKSEYQELHQSIIDYLIFLREKADKGSVDGGLLKAWYHFGEVKQNWLGYSLVGNSGSGLGVQFANALHGNLASVFSDFGREKVTKSSHLEKLCLISDGVGRDTISDFTTNLIKSYLLSYTQTFAQKHIEKGFCKSVIVEKVRFNYSTETWERDTFDLPYYNRDFVLLTPKDILTKDDIWINRSDMIKDFDHVAQSIPNDQLRSQLNNYLHSILSPNPKGKEFEEAIAKTIVQHPAFIEHYIKYKEDNGERATDISNKKVDDVYTLFVKQVSEFVSKLKDTSNFYNSTGDTLDEARTRIRFLKDVIENKDGYRLFYLDGKPIKRENDLQILYRLTWFATPSDVNREVNNGRGPVDFKVSRGSEDKALVEFKLASNSQLKRNLQNQVAIYEKANNTSKSLKAIFFFSTSEYTKVKKILRELKLENCEDVILIDVRNNNKISASKV